MKRILVVYPNNFLQGAQGTNSRVTQLIRIFNEMGYIVDFFGFEHFTGISSFKDFSEQNKEKLIQKLYIYDFEKGYYDGTEKKASKIRVLEERVKRYYKRKSTGNYLQDWIPDGAQRLFTDILEENKYDAVILFYTYLANLLKDREIKAKKIYFMEDSMFLQQYSWDEERNKKENITLGKLMDEELERISYFDEVFCISNDERIFYEKVTGKDMNFLPHLLPAETKIVTKPIEQRKWDIFFIGFDNPFNVEGLEWFFDCVYPKLNSNIRIVLVGSASNRLKVKYANVDIIPFAPDLDEIFENVKVSICPMFRGTGMKVKVVESMSKGLPVVCNERGVDGMPDKNMCGCIVTQDADIFAEQINLLIADKKYYEKKSFEIKSYYSAMFDRKKYMELLKEKLS